MKLREIRIKNFKSIEQGTIEDISDIDIFCGRNNSGKTAIFEALKTVQSCKIYRSISNVDIGNNLFSGKNFKDKIMEITLVLELDDKERSRGIKQYHDAVSAERLKDLIKSDFLQKIEYSFKSFKGTSVFGLDLIGISGTDGGLGVIARRKDNNKFSITKIDDHIRKGGPLTSHEFEHKIIATTDLKGVSQPAFAFPFRLFSELINETYVFSPFRTSQEMMPTELIKTLANNGNNLVQRIFTMKQNEDDNWEQLKEFVKNALPDLGTLQSRVVQKNQTITVFKDKKWKIEIDIHDMGSGIEQLLMIACVLISRSKGSLVLIENPEHHLHPGAQRTLLQFIRDNLKNNQILITTHSPIFLSQKDLAIHIITKREEGTKIRKAEELEGLSGVLAELGSRNSDLLLADFVLFVEGPSDEKIIKSWAKTLGLDFNSANVFCVPIGGARNFYYYANSDVLRKVSSGSPIPHLFVIDRDEKSAETIRKIQEQIKNLHILDKREIENYLLMPKYILETARTKAQGNPDLLKKLETVNTRHIEQLISSEVQKLRKVVLFKRIREEIGGGTFVPDAALKELIEKLPDKNLRTLVDEFYNVTTKMTREKCSKSRIQTIVKKQISALDQTWKKEEQKRSIAPGKEILKGIFGEFGFKYDEIKDGERIAGQMKKSEILDEIKSIVSKIEQRLK